MTLVLIYPDRVTAAEQASGLRGGATGDHSDEDDDILDDTDEDAFEDDDGAMGEEDFGEANLLGRLQQDWRKTPIITKTFFRVHNNGSSGRRELKKLSAIWNPAIRIHFDVKPC